jgi:hypothetical protein
LVLERIRNSVWIRESFPLKRTSPTIPNATAASADAEPHCSKNESYGGWIPEITNSAITATTTNAAHQIPHRSHDDDASSNWWSTAFIVPFGKYHAGKSGFREFLTAVAVWSLMFALLFGAIYLWGG